MDREIKNRSITRAGFTRIYNRFQEELKIKPVTLETISVTFRQLELKAQELLVSDKIILNFMLDDEDIAEEKVIEDRDKADSYQNLYLRTQLIVNNMQSSDHKSDSLSVNSMNNFKCKYKLPKIEWKKFGGELLDWLSFWSQFKRVHEDDNLDDEDKFQYLIQATIPGSRARQIVESYPPIGDNYQKAISSLKSRFGRDDFLIEVYVRELLKLVLSNALNQEKFNITTLYDKLETYLRALDTLGVTNDKCSAMLYPLVESSLPQELLRAWQRSSYWSYSDAGAMKLDNSNKETSSEAKNRLSQLMAFMGREVEGEARISLARTGFGFQVEASNHGFKSKRPLNQVSPVKLIPTASALATKSLSGDIVNKRPMNSSKEDCIFCAGQHATAECSKSDSLSLNDREQLLKNHGFCFRCLRKGHLSRNCRARINCNYCSGRHLRVMCFKYDSTSRKDREISSASPTTSKNEKNSTTLSSSSCSNEVVLQTLVVMLYGPRTQRPARLLIDTGSQHSYILDSTAKELGFKTTCSVTLQHALFGGIKTDFTNHDCFNVTIGPVNTNVNNLIKFKALGQLRICDYKPPVNLGKLIEETMKFGIELNDSGIESRKIELLIGADVAGQLFTGRLHRLTSSGLTAIETILGWTFMGCITNEGEAGYFSGKRDNCESNIASTLLTSTYCDRDISSLWRLDVLGIEEPSIAREKRDLAEATLNHFQDTIKFNEEGRYEVKLPWIEDCSILQSNFEEARRRLMSTTNKLIKTGYLDRYDSVFNEWLAEGLIEEVPYSELKDNDVHYLPHRAVIKEEKSTTKVRPVFDASAKTKSGCSLNSCLDKGPNLIDLIPCNLLRFRHRRYAISADIRKAFQQISVSKSDRNYLRFLWWEDGKLENIKIFRHRRVVFGVTCSPFQLQAVIGYHLNKICVARKETVDILKRSFYVDNCLTSVDTKQDVELFVKDAKGIMLAGGFDLRCWEFSGDQSDLPVPNETNVDNPFSNILGLSWNREDDTLSVSTKLFQLNFPTVTKRIILSTAHTFFDPIGFICPAILQVKQLLRESHITKIGWDSEVCSEIKGKFLKWMSEVPYLNEIMIPRWLNLGAETKGKEQMHVFTDASQLAYAAVVFVRVMKDDAVEVSFVAAKTRLAPSKPMSIPRLELMAATMGARLAETVRSELGNSLDTYYWTDSSTTLAWIQRHESWKIFVGNRVEEIRRLSKTLDWRHIAGEYNPADLPSRGCGPKKLAESKWWMGPSWLWKSTEEWPITKVKFDETIIREEKKVTNSTVLITNDRLCEWCGKVTGGQTPCCLYNGRKWYCRKFSKFNRMVRVVALVMRFINNCLKKPENRFKPHKTVVSVPEYEDAEKKIMKYIQEESHLSEEDKILNEMQAFTDDFGLLRIKTKIFERADAHDFRCPIVLPANHEVVRALILYVHQKNCHAGTQMVLNALREHYWIMGGRRTIRAALGKCTVCRRYGSRPLVPESPPLPADRVNEACPFEVTGVDLAGPLYLKDGAKCWIVLFTCALIRAVHLELVCSLSTEDFLQAFRRFIARRGRPKIVYSDNGTNFTGAARQFRQIDWSKLQRYATEERIIWKFNPPTAAWWGGWWERLIGLLKQLLRKILGRACLCFEEMTTALCDCEATINARPLTYVAEDPKDLVPLTPAMFLLENHSTGVPDCDLVDSKSLNKRLKYRQKIKNDLRARFRKEYLGKLVQKRGKRVNTNPRKPTIGEVVILESDGLKRTDWPLGRIDELIEGRDGKVRLVKLKTAKGTFLRPIQKIYPLEVTSQEATSLLKVESRKKKNKYPCVFIEQ